jgi:hypothetical protein
MRCASGVFNSVAVMYRDASYGLAAPEDPFKLCTNVSYTNIQKEACYDQMNTLAVYEGNDKLDTALAFTRRIAEGSYRTIAVKAIAVYYVQIEKAAQRPLVAEEIERVCSAVSTHSIDCLHGIIAGTMEFGKPAHEYEDGLALCGSTGTTDDFRSRCYDEFAGIALPYYPKEEQARICGMVPGAYRSTCTNALERT